MDTIHAAALYFVMVFMSPIELCIAEGNHSLYHEMKNWKDLHVHHCGLLCYNGSRIRLYAENDCESPLCFQCDCHPTCSMLDTCCPQGVVLPNGSFILSHVEPEQPPMIPPYPEQIQCDVVPYTYLTYLQVASCPDFTDPSPPNSYLFQSDSLKIRQLCEGQIDDDSSMDSIIPFVDLKNGLVFKNKFCALCNGYVLSTTEAEVLLESESVYDQDMNRVASPWILKVNCTTYQSMYAIKSFKHFLDKAFVRNSGCLVFNEEAPSKKKPIKCFRNERQFYNSLDCETPVMNLCRELNNTYLTVTRYKNIFCYICKGRELSHKIGPPNCNRDWVPRGNIPFQIPPITLLLGVTDRNTAYEAWKSKNCSSLTQWLDDHGKCQPALCSPGKNINESGKCTSVIEQIRGLAYKVFVVFLAAKPQIVTTEDIQSLSNNIHSSIADVSLESTSDINITVRHYAFDKMYATLERITVSSYFIGSDSITRDEYEDQLLSFFSKKWTLAGSNETVRDLEITPVLLGDELRESEHRNNEDVDIIKELPLGEKQTTLELETQESTKAVSFFSSAISEVTAKTKAANKTIASKTIYTQSHSTRLHHPSLWDLKKMFIDLTNSLTCPHVLVNISNTSITVEKLPKISFLLMGKTVKVSTKQKVSVVKGQLQICTSLYKRLTDLILKRTQQSILERVHFYIELMCISLSVACLLFSSLTYCLFPILRSLPGMNNLSLCMSLAVAQTCMLITARWGVNKLLPQGYCMMHAVLLHYSWLASFAWMSVCCVHMFRVFTAQSTKFTDNRSDKKRYFHYCVYGFGIPAVIVIATFVLNACMTSGESSGYSSEVCFLETRRSIWTLALSLLAPMCLVILTNGVMFVLTVRDIVNVTNLQEHRRNDRQGVITYVKLSTLTGLLGAVVLVAAQLNSSVISMLTSPLMALQGVFIFVSFTCNQRVRQLYRDLLNRLGLRSTQRTKKMTNIRPSTDLGTDSRYQIRTISTSD